MSTLRKQTRSGYTHISNELINTEGLSYRAKGIALVLLSKPDDWVIKVDYLARVGKEGEEAIRTAMKELAQYGFLMRTRELDNSGHICTITHLADYPAYIDVGTVEIRINGYQPKFPDLAVSEGSGIQASESRPVDNAGVLINPDKVTPDRTRHTEKKKNNRVPATKKRRSYQPSDYEDL